MRTKSSITMIITPLLALGLTFVGAGQAQSAPLKTNSLVISIKSSWIEEIPGFQTCTDFSRSWLMKHIGVAVNDRVTIKNSRGKTVAVGKIKMLRYPPITCALTARITKIPKSDYYDIYIGSSPVLEYFYEDLVDEGWFLDLWVSR